MEIVQSDEFVNKITKTAEDSHISEYTSPTSLTHTLSLSEYTPVRHVFACDKIDWRVVIDSRLVGRKDSHISEYTPPYV